VSTTKDWTGAGTKRLTAAELAWRNKRIHDAHKLGLSWAEIADAERVSKATARRAAREHRESLKRLGPAALLLPEEAFQRAMERSSWFPEVQGDYAPDEDVPTFDEVLEDLGEDASVFEIQAELDKRRRERGIGHFGRFDPEAAARR
jgi:hypothetical protein